jgi:6-phosphogluconate dehydrogenase
LIAEAYDVMKRGLALTDEELHEIFEGWNEGELKSYLVEITSHIFSKLDRRTNKRLIDEILDVANQTGTGLWTSQSAMELHVHLSTIDMAVAMRDLSVLEAQRTQANALYPQAIPPFAGDRDVLLTHLGRALFAGIVITYAQGMALLTVASDAYKYHLDLEAVARIWRGGCIIRSALLENIRLAFQAKPHLSNLLLDPIVSRLVLEHQQDLRRIVCYASESGLPTPGLMASLSYLDAYRSAWLPANLIQAQRDYFGAHAYERTDAKGTFHTEWEEKQEQ